MSNQVGAITARTAFVLLLATWPRRIVLGVLLLVPVLVLALGGFGRAEPRSYELQPGQWVDLGPYSVRVDSYFVSDQVLPLFLDDEDPDDAYLGVILQVENTEDVAVSPGSDFQVFVPALPEGAVERTSAPSYSLLVADSVLGAQVMPGLPTEIALLWEAPDGAALPQDGLQLELTESEFTYSLMGDEDRWLSIGDVWSVTLPRVEPPASIVEEETT